MPAMNGWEFIENYRSLKQSISRHPVIVMLTSSINPDDEMRALNIREISEHLHKPLPEDVLATLLTKHFPDRV
jgi:CheY-like chemotaxis protein